MTNRSIFSRKNRKNTNTRDRRKGRPLLLQQLETRKLFAGDVFLQDGVLNVQGSDRAEEIRLEYQSEGQEVSATIVNARGQTEVQQTFRADEISRLEVNAGGGDDVVRNNTDLYAIVHGGAGNDILIGGDGWDDLHGGDGNDHLYGGGDWDILNGQAGDDVIYGGGGNDEISGGQGYNKMYGEAGDDTIAGGDDWDDIYGGDGNDTLSGGGDDDIIDGGEGNDVLHGGSGNDELYGQSGLDEIFGSGGDDVIDGGGDMDFVQHDDGVAVVLDGPWVVSDGPDNPHVDPGSDDFDSDDFEVGPGVGDVVFDTPTSDQEVSDDSTDSESEENEALEAAKAADELIKGLFSWF